MGTDRWSVPPGSDRRRGRRMPTVRPIGLSFGEPDGDELRLLARLHPHKDRALAVLLRLAQGAAHVHRIGHLLAADLENDVAGLEALTGRKPIGAGLGH